METRSYWTASENDLDCDYPYLRETVIPSNASDKDAAAKHVQQVEAHDCSFDVASGNEVETVYVLEANKCDRYDFDTFRKEATAFEVRGETLPMYYATRKKEAGSEDS